MFVRNWIMQVFSCGCVTIDRDANGRYHRTYLTCQRCRTYPEGARILMRAGHPLTASELQDILEGGGRVENQTAT